MLSELCDFAGTSKLFTFTYVGIVFLFRTFHIITSCKFGSNCWCCSNMQLVSTLRVNPEYNLLFFNPDAKVDITIMALFKECIGMCVSLSIS